MFFASRGRTANTPGPRTPYRPTGKPRKKVALIGKGLTFDSGGYNIKVLSCHSLPGTEWFDWLVDNCTRIWLVDRWYWYIIQWFLVGWFGTWKYHTRTWLVGWLVLVSHNDFIGWSVSYDDLIGRLVSYDDLIGWLVACNDSIGRLVSYNDLIDWLI